jgi:hypothetical protein
MDIVGNPVHPMVQILFSKNDTIFQDDNSPIRTAISVQSQFEEREDIFQHLPWPAQLPDLNIIEPLWSVLECRVKANSLLQHLSKQLQNVQETIQNWSLLQEGYKLYYRQMVAQLHINIEIHIFHNCFHSLIHPLYIHSMTACLAHVRHHPLNKT